MVLKLEDIPVVNLGKFLIERMEIFGETVALVDGTTENVITYKELIERIKRLAAGLQSAGARKDDVISIVAPNSPDYLVLFYASALIGTTFLPLNALAPNEDMEKIIRQCGSKIMFTTTELLPKVSEVMELLSNNNITKPQLVLFGEPEGYTTFESLLNPKHGKYTTPPGDPKNDTVALLLSSGTTGFPKPVCTSHYSIVAHVLQQMTAGLNKAGDTYVTFLPLFHAFGLYIVSYFANYVGARLVIMSRFDADNYLRLIEKYKPNILQVVPPIMVMFSKSPKVSEYCLSSVKMVICGAAPLGKDTEEAVKKRLNLSCIFQGYGMTEVGVTHMNTIMENRYKSVGKLLPLVEMKIVDVDTGRELGPNEEGEIWVKGPQICNGYLNLPEKNKELFTDDGWVKTGDIGREDEDGYLYVVDRLKELIKYNANQVAPATLEDILLSYQPIADAGVVGMPDEDAGELPRAYVVLKHGHSATEEEIQTYVAGHVAPYMKLRGGVEFVTSIPRTASGKILRKALKEHAREYASKLYEQFDRNISVNSAEK